MLNHPFVGSLAIGAVALIVGISLPTAAATKDAHDHWGNWSEFSLFLVTAVLVVATLVLARFTFNLWKETGKLVDDARLNAKTQLRAYVGVVYPEVKIDGVRLIASIDYQNSGQTPAHDVEVYMSAKIFSDTPKWTKPGTADDALKGGVLLPNVFWQKYRPVEEASYSGDLREEILAQKKRIWVWGTISYRDIYGEPCHVQFRFWSGQNEREERPYHWGTGKTGKFIPLIADLAHSKATYGKQR
jgi:hypothetical protein